MTCGSSRPSRGCLGQDTGCPADGSAIASTPVNQGVLSEYDRTTDTMAVTQFTGHLRCIMEVEDGIIEPGSTHPSRLTGLNRSRSKRILGRAFARDAFIIRRRQETSNCRCRNRDQPLLPPDRDALSGSARLPDRRGRRPRLDTLRDNQQLRKNDNGALTAVEPRLAGWAVVFGMLCVAGLSLPAAWSTVAADDQSSLGTGIYPAAYAITGPRS